MSFQAKAFNPGNVNVRLGAVISDYEAAFAAGDLERASNCLRLAKGHLAHYMTQPQKVEYDAMPGYAAHKCPGPKQCQSTDHRSRSQVAEDMEVKREYLLEIAVEKNVWARGEPEEGDASTLGMTPANYAEASS
jgi:hypothetical protein